MAKSGHRILVIDEKHGYRYFDAATDEQLHAAALKIVEERLGPNYQFITPPDQPQPRSVLTDEQLEALPDGSTKQHAERERKAVQREKKTYAEDLAAYEKAVDAVHHRNGRAAWEVLQARSDGEYEGYSLEILE